MAWLPFQKDSTYKVYYVESVYHPEEVPPATAISNVQGGQLKLPSIACTYIPTQQEQCIHPSGNPPKGRGSPPRSILEIQRSKLGNGLIQQQLFYPTMVSWRLKFSVQKTSLRNASFHNLSTCSSCCSFLEPLEGIL